MNLEGFSVLNSLNLQTELLEAFDWDEQSRDEFNIWLIDALNSSFDLTSLIYEVKISYGNEIATILTKIFKSEIDKINDERIKKGKIYEA